MYYAIGSKTQKIYMKDGKRSKVMTYIQSIPLPLPELITIHEIQHTKEYRIIFKEKGTNVRYNTLLSLKEKEFELSEEAVITAFEKVKQLSEPFSLMMKDHKQRLSALTLDQSIRIHVSENVKHSTRKTNQRHINPETQMNKAVQLIRFSNEQHRIFEHLMKEYDVKNNRE